MTQEALVKINLLDNCGFGLIAFGLVDTMIDFEQVIEKVLRAQNEADSKWQRNRCCGWFDCK